MRPPICEVCDHDFDPGDGGRRVRFLLTDAGRDFAERSTDRGFVGHPPDDGWFCEHHVMAAESLSATHTLSAAVTQIRVPEQTGAPEPEIEPERPRDSTPAPSRDPQTEQRFREFRAEIARRRATRIDHEVGRRARQGSVQRRFEMARDLLLERLGLLGEEPEEARSQSTSPSPEWREQATATEVSTRWTWRSAEHQVWYSFTDMYWDGADRTPRTGDFVQGTIGLSVDDTQLYAPIGPSQVVTQVLESGERTPEVSDLIDDLLHGLRFRS